MTEKLSLCVCGASPKLSTLSTKWVECTNCMREVTAHTRKEAAIGWNAWMKALREAK